MQQESRKKGPQKCSTLSTLHNPQLPSKSTINPNLLNPRHAPIPRAHLALHNIRSLAHDSNQVDFLRLVTKLATVVQELSIQLLELPQILFDSVEIDQRLLDLRRGGAVVSVGRGFGDGGVGGGRVGGILGRVETPEEGDVGE